MRPRHTRTAFTLVELLVVIAIIGTLMGLLLPAVQSAREAGRRNSCQNNMNQLGKAVMGFEGQMQAIPGWRNPHPSGNPTAVTVSWPVMILPNLERRDIYQNYEKMPQLPTRPVSTAPFISIFACPTAPSVGTGIATLAYAGNAGALSIGDGNQQVRGDGVFLDVVGGPLYAGTRTNLDVISGADGTSNTLLFAEKCNSLALQTKWDVPITTPLVNSQMGRLETNPNHLFPSTMTDDDVPVFGIGDQPDPDGGKVINSTQPARLSAQPSSNHPGGVVVAFADGHTRFLRDTVLPHVYAQLLTSDSRWDGPAAAGATGRRQVYSTNSAVVNRWLRWGNAPVPYNLSEADF